MGIMGAICAGVVVRHTALPCFITAKRLNRKGKLTHKLEVFKLRYKVKQNTALNSKAK
jgi:hypothetical protein